MALTPGSPPARTELGDGRRPVPHPPGPRRGSLRCAALPGTGHSQVWRQTLPTCLETEPGKPRRQSRRSHPGPPTTRPLSRVRCSFFCARGQCSPATPCASDRHGDGHFKASKRLPIKDRKGNRPALEERCRPSRCGRSKGRWATCTLHAVSWGSPWQQCDRHQVPGSCLSWRSLLSLVPSTVPPLLCSQGLRPHRDTAQL